MMNKLKIAVKDSPVEGKGMFATSDIKNGEIVCVMEGEKISIPELKRRYTYGKERICDPLQISERQYLDMVKPYVYINHSCEPNLAMTKISTLIALRDIKKGEEVFYDYSTTEWTYDNFGKYAEWSMDCICGNKNCRKIIVQFPFLPKKLQDKYLELKAVPDFILRKAKCI